MLLKDIVKVAIFVDSFLSDLLHLKQFYDLGLFILAVKIYIGCYFLNKRILRSRALLRLRAARASIGAGITVTRIARSLV